MIVIETELAVQIPEEVLEWVKEREALYPKVTFQIRVWTPHVTEKEIFVILASKYKKIYSFAKSYPGVLAVGFPYAHERWSVKIIGGFDADNAITEDSSPENLQHPLPATLRGEIANVPKFQDLEKIPPFSSGHSETMGERR